MINALFSSKNNGTKDFTLNGAKFGWKAIVSLYKRDCERVSKKFTRMVPKMKEAYVIRDAWTKLNVAPAKIMQVRIKYKYNLPCYLTYFILAIVRSFSDGVKGRSRNFILVGLY